LLLLLQYLLLDTPVPQRLLHEVQHLDGAANSPLRREALLLFLDPAFEIEDLRIPVLELVLNFRHGSSLERPCLAEHDADQRTIQLTEINLRASEPL